MFVSLLFSYRSLDRLGSTMSGVLSNFGYVKNEKASDYNHEETIEWIEENRVERVKQEKKAAMFVKKKRCKCFLFHFKLAYI